MNTLRNTEQCRQNQAKIDLAAPKALCTADQFLLDLYLEVRVYFESYDLSAIKTMSTLLSNYVQSSLERLPTDMEDAKYTRDEIDRNVRYLSETIALISELQMRWQAVSIFQKEASLNAASIFYQTETAPSK